MIQAQEHEQQQWQIYDKLQQARIALQSTELKKSGYNKFQNYAYFELKDFLPTINNIFVNLGLCHSLEFDKELATMRIFDRDTGGQIKFTCPMAEANMKGNQPVQNLGASITYITRYLFVMALAICEHDAIDASEPVAPASAKPITVDVFSNMSEQEQQEIRSYGVDVIALLSKSDVEGAVEYINMLELGADEKTALWSLLDSKQRSAIKKFTTR
jgi:hypothetical protein